jgi:hypothetical protein
MAIETGVTGTVYHCSIDGNTYKVTGEHTAVRVTDQVAIDGAKNTFITNWRNFRVEGENSDRPAGAGPKPIDASQPNNLVAIPVTEPPKTGSGNQFTQDELIRHFISKGFTKAGAIGIVANLRAENDLRTTGPTGSQGEEGLAQWKGPRLANLKTYAADHKLDWRSKGAQLGFLDHELTTNYSGVYAKVKNATDPQQAAEIFCAGFESPTLDNGTPNYPTYTERKRIAAEIAATA